MSTSDTPNGPITFADANRRAYALTLTALQQPWPLLMVFNVLTAAALGLIASPALAAGWAAGSVALDAALKHLHTRWAQTVEETPNAVGLRRLTLACTVRSAAWIAAPLIAVAHDPAPTTYAFLAITVGALVATAASAGWASRGVWYGTAAPAVLGAAAVAARDLDAAGTLGLAFSLAAFALTAALIRIATHRLIADAIEATQRTNAVMEELQSALAQSELAERSAAEARDAVARSEERLSVAMQMAEMHVWELDYQRRELVKSGAEDTFFTEPKTFEELEADIYCVVDPRDRPAVHEAWVRHLEEGTPFQPEYRIVRRDDREVWAASNLRLITDDQRRPLRLIGAIRNVTERKQAERQLLQAKEEAEAANRTKSQFLANMSHEIRTPMNGVIGMNELLLRTPLSPDQRKYAEAVRTSADALLDLINDILDLSKLEAGKVELESIDFSLARVVEDVVELLAPKAVEKGLEIACYLDPGARAAFVGDPTRLRQVLLNLASNAVKFTETGHVAIEVRSHARQDGRTGLRIEVQDTGIGLDDEQKDKLFRNFQQADGSTTRKYGGTGLGLSISRQLVELMGGRIGVADGRSGGSTFWFEVALAEGTATDDGPVIPRSLSGLRVLVVDDLAINRAIFRDHLEHAGAVVSEVDGGEACLRRLAEAHAGGQPIDLVLLDHQMPSMAGDEVAARIRARADWGRPKIVMASSMGAPPAGDPSYDAFLGKPVRQAALISCLANVLGAEPLDDEAPAVPALQLEGAEAVAHVLLAEDNEINTLLATEILRQVGLSCECVKNGREAVEAAAAGAFDLILMDVHMPEMDGLEATRRIRALPGPRARVPIVAMTANAMKSDQEACLAAGMDDFVSKPFKPHEFIAALEKALDGRGAADGEEGLERAIA